MSARNNALPLDLLVDINSVGVRDTFTIGKLNTIIIEKYNENLPNDKITQLSNLSQAQGIFGYESNVVGFASVYFGFLSKNATKCDYLFVYNWNNTDLPAILKGSKAPSLSVLQGLKGCFNLTLGNVTKSIKVDFTDFNGEVIKDYQSAAQVLQEAIREVGTAKPETPENPDTSGDNNNTDTENKGDGDNNVGTDTEQGTDTSEVATFSIRAINENIPNFLNAEVSYNSHTGGFIIKGGNEGEGETIGYLTKCEILTENADEFLGYEKDLSEMLGLTEAEGATIYEGLNAVSSFAEVLDDIYNNNGNYYLITPNFEFEKNELEKSLLEFGNFLHNSNDRYAGIYSWNNIQLETLGSNATRLYEGYNGLIIDYKRQEYQNALIASFISGLDLTKNSGNYNIAFNDATNFQINAITQRMAYEALIANKANAPCKFGILGQDDTIYMDGTILGTKTDSINIYVCNSFLKFNQQIQLFNMFKSQRLIGVRGSQSKAIVYSYLDSVFQKAVNANIIAQGVELTTTEINSVIATFGALVDDINIVIDKLETSGYFYIISNIDITKREISITEAYTANTPAKKVIINNYILGA